jgi:hypothetical protein
MTWKKEACKLGEKIMKQKVKMEKENKNGEEKLGRLK